MGNLVYKNMLNQVFRLFGQFCSVATPSFPRFNLHRFFDIPNTLGRPRIGAHPTEVFTSPTSLIHTSLRTKK